MWSARPAGSSATSTSYPQVVGSAGAEQMFDPVPHWADGGRHEQARRARLRHHGRAHRRHQGRRGAAGASAAPARAGPDALKHCWVRGDHGRVPALLIEWRRTPAGWQGRVVHPVRDPVDGVGWILVEEWLPAGALDQA